MNATRAIAFVAIALWTSGCTSWVKKGDAAFHESDGRIEWGFPMGKAPWHRLRFPAVKIDHAGETILRVRDLPVPLCPSIAELEMPAEEARDWQHGQPWRSGVLEVIIRRLDGTIHYSSKIALSEWRGSTGPGSSGSRRRIWIEIGPWNIFRRAAIPMLSDYDLVVRVLTPSARVGDSLFIQAAIPFKQPNKAQELTTGSVTHRADARCAPAPVVAHL